MKELLDLVTAIVQSIEPDQRNFSFLLGVTDDTLSNLRAVLPEKLVEASLDIVDRSNVIHYVTNWGHSEYEVLGSLGNYTVLLDLPVLNAPFSCTCPAFIYSVLTVETHVMCKHVLACVIARRMNLTTERPAIPDDLASLYVRQFPPVDNGAGQEPAED